VTASTSVFFVAKLYKNCFGGKKEAKVTIFGGKKKGHMEPFKQMSDYWSPELGSILKRFYLTV
jgi:hypothetical protein